MPLSLALELVRTTAVGKKERRSSIMSSSHSILLNLDSLHGSLSLYLQCLELGLQHGVWLLQRKLIHAALINFIIIIYLFSEFAALQGAQKGIQAAGLQQS